MHPSSSKILFWLCDNMSLKLSGILPWWMGAKRNQLMWEHEQIQVKYKPCNVSGHIQKISEAAMQQNGLFQKDKFAQGQQIWGNSPLASMGRKGVFRGSGQAFATQNCSKFLMTKRAGVHRLKILSPEIVSWIKDSSACALPGCKDRGPRGSHFMSQS